MKKLRLACLSLLIVLALSANAFAGVIHNPPPSGGDILNPPSADGGEILTPPSDGGDISNPPSANGEIPNPPFIAQLIASFLGL